MDINKLYGGQVSPVNKGLQEGAGQAVTAERITHASSEAERSAPDLSRQNLKDLADTLNVAAKSMNQRVSFSFNEKISRVVMKVINTSNNEVVREIPPKEMVRVYEHIHDLLGMFFDESR